MSECSSTPLAVVLVDTVIVIAVDHHPMELYIHHLQREVDFMKDDPLVRVFQQLLCPDVN